MAGGLDGGDGGGGGGGGADPLSFGSAAAGSTGTVVDWGDSSITSATTQAVYVRERWGDPWQLERNLWAIERVWSLLPAVPTAVLTLHYGQVLPHGGSGYVPQSKLNLAGWYVKIVDTCEDGFLTWVGYIDEIADEQGGASASGIATGAQTFVAYSMAHTLNHEYITRSRWNDPQNAVDRWSGSAGTFNENGKGNMYSAQGDTTGDDHVFDYGHFNRNYGSHWSSRDIVRYLFDYAKPLDKDGNEKLKFRVEGLDLIPDWDKPTIESEGRSVLSLLADIVNPSRLLQLSTTLDESTNPDTVVFKVHSLASSDITLPNSETFTANESPLTLQTMGSHDTQIVIQGSVSARVDQVIVKGALRESCGTFKIVTKGTNTQKLQEAFTSTIVTAYQDGSKNHPSYSGWTTAEKRRANEIARSRHGAADAYRVFTINEVSNFAVGLEYVFENDDASRYYPWWNKVKFMPQLPFKRGVDYSGTAISGNSHNDEDKPDDFRGPLVLFKKPSSSPSQYIQAEKLASVDRDPVFSVGVGIEYNGACFTLDVQGAEQHAIAHGRFTGQSEDRTTAQLGSWDYRDALCTVSIQEDRYAEGRYPTDNLLPSGMDRVRRMIIYAGPSYKQVRVLDDTTVDVDDAGAIEETIGSDYIRDDTEKLESIARIASEWYSVTRKVFRLVSARPSARPYVGQLLTSINAGTIQAETINTVVSEIRLSTPLGENGAVPVASYSITTAAGELDPLAFAPPQPSVPLADQAIAPLVQR